MPIVKNILNIKGWDVWTVPVTATIKEALILMAEKNIGAVVVMDGDQIVGIYSERDYARHASQQDKLLLEEPVVDHMTRAVYFVTPQQPIEECMMLMTSRHIRHIPVLEDETRLVGIISIGDVVKHVLEEKENTIVGLENYILGRDYSG